MNADKKRKKIQEIRDKLEELRARRSEIDAEISALMHDWSLLLKEPVHSKSDYPKEY
jgi:uncharacterized coiled-coil DUF342 family protein